MALGKLWSRILPLTMIRGNPLPSQAGIRNPRIQLWPPVECKEDRVAFAWVWTLRNINCGMERHFPPLITLKPLI